MTDRKQFEAMLEALINEDQETAKEIFHNIVVAKSREIYEELLESDFDLNEGENPFASKEEGEEEEEESADDSSADDSDADDSADDSDADSDADGEEDGEEGDVGGDATDDMMSDIDGEESDSGEGEIEDRVLDLEDALEELKAEFEQLMASEEGEDHAAGDEMGGDEFGAEPAGDDFGGADMGGAAGDDEMAQFMEYVNKVALPKHGDDGANTKSIVAGKNDMGGTTANIAKGGTSTTGGTEGGLASPKAGDLTSGLGTIHNRVNSNSGKTAFKKKEPGHGAEKAGAKETADKSAGSPLNGAPKRAK